MSNETSSFLSQSSLATTTSLPSLHRFNLQSQSSLLHQPNSQQQKCTISSDSLYDLPLCGNMYKFGEACGSPLVSLLQCCPPTHRNDAIASLQAWAQYTRPKTAIVIKNRLEHILSTFQGLALGRPTYAPFYVEDPSYIIYQKLPFPVRALLEYYIPHQMLLARSPDGSNKPGCQSFLADIHRTYEMGGALPQIEDKLAQAAGKTEGTRQKIAEAFDHPLEGGDFGAVDWEVRLIVEEASSTGFAVQHLGPVRMKGTSTYMHRHFGLDRFMRVHINRRRWLNDQGYQAFQVLATEGISFACRKYRYVGHKPDAQNVCYFFAEESTGQEQTYFQALKTYHLINIMGYFSYFQSVSRLVARVALGFSRSLAFTLRPDEVGLIDDKVVNGNLLTDGAGFISLDLIKRLPSHLFQGRVTHELQPDLPAKPFAVVQVRVLCHLGGFKGTLLVDPRLEGSPCKVRLRRHSMLKFPPTKAMHAHPSAPTLDVLTSFRVVRAFTRLSRELVLILLAIGVPAKTLRKLVEDELQELGGIYESSRKALAFLHHSSVTALRGSSEWQVAEMLKAGHDCKEPYIQKTLEGLRSLALSKLKGGRIRCPGSLYVVGQPDPLGVLKQNEVFLSHGLPTNTWGLPEGQGDDGAFEGPMLIARHPIHQPSHIQVFHAVRHPYLASFLGPRAGVLFFSTQGPESPCVWLSNGDMDGDTYFVCMNPEIVAHAKPPLPQRSTSKSFNPLEQGCDLVSPVGPFSLYDKNIGPVIDSRTMSRCFECFFAQSKMTEIVALASEWWLTYADSKGAACNECAVLGSLNAKALDSAKTGQLWALPQKLKPLHTLPPHLVRTKPHLVRTKPKSQSKVAVISLSFTTEMSLLAQIHTRVSEILVATTKDQEYHDKRSSPSKAIVRVVPLDPDLRVKGASARLQVASRWLDAYRKSFAFSRIDSTSYQALRADMIIPFRRVFQETTRGSGKGPRSGRHDHDTEAVEESLALASAVYEVTYMNGSYLYFAWDLAMEELNLIKQRALSSKKGSMQQPKLEKQQQQQQQQQTPLRSLQDNVQIEEKGSFKGKAKEV